jgi:predicted ATP-dependent endonuclease of OLD family
MFHISRVEITGFWGKHKVEADFLPDVNIFIGKNGTGKTTFMNILQSVLQVDLPTLISYEFKSIVMRLRSDSKTRTIKVERNDKADLPFEEVTYRVGARSFKMQVFERDYELGRPVRHRLKFRDQYEALKLQLNELVRVSSLSVHRTSATLVREEEYPRRHNYPHPPIDQRLSELMQQLTRYQLSLELKARRVSSEFQKDVLASMLYDPDFDKWDLQEALNVELGKEKQELSKAYSELGALDDKVQKKIDTHIEILNKSLNQLRDKKDEGVPVEAVVPLPLLRRTQHIINLTQKAEAQKQEIFQPINQYVATIKGFIEDKEFKFSPTGEFQIFKENKQISFDQLSSGEKQLLILLTETLLQKGEPFVFLADEPEISLHIEWQAKIVSSIKELNQKAQVIVATHSVEIAGGWKKNVIDMEDIVHG